MKRKDAQERNHKITSSATEIKNKIRLFSTFSPVPEKVGEIERPGEKLFNSRFSTREHFRNECASHYRDNNDLHTVSPAGTGNRRSFFV